MTSATQLGFGAPSTSKVKRIVTWAPPAMSSAPVELGTEPHLRADRHGRREAHLLAAVVDGHRDAVHPHDLRRQHRPERQGEVAVGDRAAERALLLRPLGVDVDPLVVAGGVGEQVHLLLGDLDVVGVPEVLADLRPSARAMPSIDRASWPRSMSVTVSGTRSAGTRGSAGGRAGRTAPPGRWRDQQVDVEDLADGSSARMITSGTRARTPTRPRRASSAHLYSLAMPRPASAEPTTSTRPSRPIGQRRTRSAEDRVDVEQEHPRSAGSGAATGSSTG